MIEQEGLKIESKLLDRNSNTVLIGISGYIDQANSHLLQSAIEKNLRDKCYNLIFNLQKLHYMSSAGWGNIIGEIKRFRENGGDIKLVNMSPEIYEIYQMLEFYHIISEYPSIDEALKSFQSNKNKHIQAIEEVNIELQTQNQDKNDATAEMRSLVPLTSQKDSSKTYVQFDPKKYTKKTNPKTISIFDKIRLIVSKHPEYPPRKIRKVLRQPDYGSTKIGYFKLRSILKGLDLNSRKKRFRYYRSA